MKKLLPLIALLFILVATPVFASSDKNRDENCEDRDFDNHGRFVSCVAKTHLGGAVVSSAAQSDIGKKDHDDDRDDENDEDEDEDNDDGIHASPTPLASPNVSPSPSPSVSPSPSISPSPIVSPSPEASATPIASASPEFSSEQRGILNSIVEKLNDLIELLNNLLK